MISIIIAIYNISPYLRRCLDSVINQTYGQLQIILVDDGSTDDCGTICDEYAQKDSRIVVIHKTNGGLSDAWNAGLLVATGEYIGFVDGDDYIEPDMYERMLEALVLHNADMAVCRYRPFVARPVGIELSHPSITLTSEQALLAYISEDEKIRIMPSVWSKLFRRQLVKNLTFTVGQTSQDIMYTTAALCLAKRIAFVDAYLYNYNDERASSITNQKNSEKFLRIELGPLRERIAYLKTHGRVELSDKASYYFYRRMLFYYMDFRKEKNKEAVARLVAMLRDEQATIRAIYKNTWIKRGDAARMKLFCFWPRLYYIVVLAYDALVIPLRRA